MILLTRSLARQLPAVFRKSFPVGSSRGLKATLVLEADRRGLRARLQAPDVAIEYQQPGSHAPGVVSVPLDGLDNFIGRQDVEITLERHGPDTTVARWDDGGIPQVRQYVAGNGENLASFPEPPTRFASVDATVLQALDAARQCVARDSVRYALQRVQLRGAAGEIVASDGKQLFVQKGCLWPWKDDLLVPALSVFGVRELPTENSVGIARTATHLVLRVGPWTFYMAIDSAGRYPKVDQVIPSLTGPVTTCRLSPEDAEFLARTLPRLPGADEDDSPLTLDLNGHVAVRARVENQERATELLLSRSAAEGPPVRFVGNRQYLARMVQLGFRELSVVKADVPVVAKDEKRTYVWMPLGKEGAIGPSDDCLCIVSHGKSSKSIPTPKARIIPMSAAFTNNKNGHVAAAPHATGDPGIKTPTSINSLMEEAAELKTMLRDAYVRVGQLLDGLKRHRQQSKLLRNTLSSLKQLQQIGD